eukprot:CAMPEP_0178404012 /NCGR_PEP_ID=MMETSP0689_2-20121128/17662_1 /TAXON_ID=160604 /ORGANISM="Amphidinium massartii, Strain CS-259" /LENGTH=568 /DNA_ID=CAMNT_0020024979 /DNA_START=14 /DNA_END=1720 /DNA_ORIENTATION=-
MATNAASDFEKLLQQLKEAHAREVQELRSKLAQLEPGFKAPIAPPPAAAAAAASGTGVVAEGGSTTADAGSATASPAEQKPAKVINDAGSAEPASPPGFSRADSPSGDVSPKPKGVRAKTHSHASSHFADALNDLQRSESQNLAEVDGKRNFLQRVVLAQAFETVFSVLILANCVQFALLVQFEGMNDGANMGLTGVVRRWNDETGWAAVVDILEVMGHIFSALFVVEGCLKLAAYGPRGFVNDWWNWFDTFVSLCWLLDFLTFWDLPLPAGTLRSLRVVRLLRVVRVLRKIQFGDSLFLLNAALGGSVSVLFWALLYLAVLQLTFAVLMTSAIHGLYLQDSTASLSEKQEVFDYFGTTTRATLTVFEMTMANWPPVCRVMADAVGEWWILVALIHKLTFGFALLGIINGAVMQEIFKVAAQDADVMVREKQRAMMHVRRTLKDLFNMADTTEDGRLDVEEFTKLCRSETLKTWLSSIGLNTKDAGKVFRLLDDGDGHLDADEFLEGVERFRGMASGIDMHHHLKDVTKQMEVQRGQMDVHDKKLVKLAEEIERLVLKCEIEWGQITA